jgi:hypothetical protein
MSWLFSQALVAGFSEANSSAGAPSAPLSGTATPQAYLLPDRMTESWNRFPSGMTCEPLTANHGEGLLTWFREASLAKTSAQREKAQGSTENAAGCGITWPESLAKYDPASSSWKTRQCSLFEDSDECLETFPRWGMMRDGELWELATPEHLTSENESGFWPTPQMVDYKGTSSGSKFQQRNAQFSTWANGEAISGTIYPHPDFYDALMAWPTGWSALNALGTDKFQQWLRSHGKL